MPLLLPSKSNPLCWASIWYTATGKPRYFNDTPAKLKRPSTFVGGLLLCLYLCGFQKLSTSQNPLYNNDTRTNFPEITASSKSPQFFAGLGKRYICAIAGDLCMCSYFL